MLHVPSETFPVGDTNLDLMLAASKLETCIVELWWAHPALSPIGSARTLDGYSEKVGVQLSVIIFVVKYSYSIEPLLQIGEATRSFQVRNWDHRLFGRVSAGKRCCVLWGEQGACHLAVVALQFRHLHDDLACRRHLTTPASCSLCQSQRLVHVMAQAFGVSFTTRRH